ncbi:MAG: bifunctional tetrahydrofolate synthase/dihydrofolate synthase [Gammaproteobacteria bacterium]|nr:bifunctional tetrahydrofolate synthase/dihydrofolate synthase [Gammaproteobacteria bacterium]
MFASTMLLEQALNPNLFQFGPRRLEVLAQYASKLDCLHWHIPVVTVTGTNGKGSTVTALKSIYQAAGFMAGVYTSPHLLSYHERISVNDKMISEDELIEAIRAVDDILEDSSPISFFERLTLVALYYFKQQPLDVLILEVGLGGRLDAVNIIDADVVIVTTVDLDHQDYLGDTIEAIAFEKAGVFRSKKQAIFADIDCPRSIQEHANNLGTRLHHYAVDYNYVEAEDTLSVLIGEQSIKLIGKAKLRIQALVAAIYASTLLIDKLPVAEQAWQFALDHSFLPGRLQCIPLHRPRLIVDVSHNPQGVRYLTQEIKKIANDVQVHAIFSMMKDKNAVECVQEFNKLSPIWYNTILNGERSHTEGSMKKLFEECSLPYQFFPSPEQALNAARLAASANDVIVVFGSFLMVEPIMKILMEEGYNVISAQ